MGEYGQTGGIARGAAVLLVADASSSAAQELRQAVAAIRPAQLEMVTTSEQALQVIATQQWDLIFWWATRGPMPGQQGLGRIIQAQPWAAVVAVVGPDEIAAAAEALKAGAVAYLIIDGSVAAAVPAILSAALEQLRLRHRARQAQAEAELSRLRSRLLEQLAREAIFQVSPQGNILSANPAARQMTGLAPESGFAPHISHILRPPELFQRMVALLSGQRDPGETGPPLSVMGTEHGPCVIAVEAFIKRAEGAYEPVSVSAAAVRDPTGSLRSVLVVASPVSEGPPVAEQAQRARRMLDAVLQWTTQGVAIVEASGVVLRVNPAAAELLGLGSAEEAPGQPLGVLLPQAERLEDAVQRALEQGQPVKMTLSHPAGPLAIEVVPVRNGRGAAWALVLIAPAGEVAEAVVQARTAKEQARALRKLASLGRPQLEEAIEAICSLAAALVGAPVVAAAVRLPDGQSVWAATGIGGVAAGELGEALASLIAAAPPQVAGPVQVQEAAAAGDRLAEVLLRAGAVSYIAAPLARSGRAFGALLIAGTGRGQVGAEQRTLAELAAAEASAILAAMAGWREESQQAERLLSMFEVAKELTMAGAQDEVMGALLRGLVRVYAADWASAFLLAEDGTELEQSWRADRTGEVEAATAMPAEAYKACWRALQTHQPVLATVEEPDGRWDVLAVELGTERALGAVCVAVDRPEAWTDEEERRQVSTLVRIAAACLEQVRALEIQRQQASVIQTEATEAREVEARARSLLQAAAAVAELTDLDEVLSALVRAGLRAINLEELRVYLADHETRQLRGAVLAKRPDTILPLEENWPLQPGASVYSDAALSDSPYIVAAVDGTGEAHEAAIVPMRTQTGLVGVMVGSNPTSRREISAQDVRLLRTLASLASVAIERARVQQLRDMMSRTVSHELRAPLSSIRAYAELVLDEGAGPINEEQRLFLQRVVSACEYLERLIEDLMDLSKLRTGEISLRPAEVDLLEIIEQVLDALRPRIEEREINVELEVQPSARRLITDPMRVAQILTNLVDNAVKFNYPGGQVKIGAKREDEWIVVWVSDTGPGIPEAEKEAIFQEFYRRRDELTQSRPGAGLGLAIARRVAYFLGGDLTVESVVGEGSTFYLRLPVQPRGLQPPEGGDKREEVTRSGAGAE